MARALVLLALTGTLLATASAEAAFRPVARGSAENAAPLLRAGTLTVPERRGEARLTVLVGLHGAPLAAHHRALASTRARARLRVGSASSRAYLSRLAAQQRAAEASLRAAIPEARVARRHRILLNALAVELPATAVPRLARQAFAARVYPSLRYALNLDRSPAVIGADALRRVTGADGNGVRIAVVDDGVDPTNPFFDPRGYAYPAGFPRGQTRWVSPKVIVAKSFVGTVRDSRSSLAVDRRVSFHGTHVAGIAAGAAGTTATAGAGHPATANLSGVAPRAWIGNYRVFNAPTPIGHVANTPEIVAAFEAAVADGMDVVNFSGGGPETEPSRDAVLEAVRNLAAAGVVPVIAAGNDRDDFGYGTAGSPGTAPEAITVAAVSNDHVYAPALTVNVPGVPASLTGIPFLGATGTRAPATWSTRDMTLVDVASVVGTNRRPVDPYLCGTPDPNGDRGTLPNRSLRGAIALVLRGRCTFVSKAARAYLAGAAGVVFVDNRPGEANGIPVRLALPGGMVSDLDGARLRAFLAGRGGRAPVRIGRAPLELTTGRAGVVTSFSAAGLTAFGHRLKPDLAAPGGQIISSTLPEQGGPFAVYDGTSMATPHVAGAAALLAQLHPAWSPAQVKSALMSTAGPAYGDTARTAEASVLLAGTGLANVAAADRPLVFTEPASLSFGDLDVRAGAAERQLLLTVTDAGDGAGTWTAEVAPQAQPAGVTVEVPAAVAVSPGGSTVLPVVARATAEAASGNAHGLILLRRGTETRRVAYAFLVVRPQLAGLPVKPLRRLQTGDTRKGVSRVERYRYPEAPFGQPPDYVGAPMRESGSETLYSVTLGRGVVNAGVSVLAGGPGSLVHPWYLRTKDESSVQGFAGTPVNVNPMTFDFPLDVGAAGVSFPAPGRYVVAVDSGRDLFTGRKLNGTYVLNAWTNDLKPPLIGLVTARVAAGRPTLAVRAVDLASGVDPFSIVLSYRGVLLAPAAYDAASGIALFVPPPEAPPLPRGTVNVVVTAADFQEAKNLNTTGPDPTPNTTFASGGVRVVDGVAATWLTPEARECVEPRASLALLASSTAPIRSVRFYDGPRLVATDRTGVSGLYEATWRTGAAARRAHRLRAVVSDARGRTADATRVARVCRPR